MYNDSGMGLHTPFSPLFVEPVSTSMGTGSFLFNRVRVEFLSVNISEVFPVRFRRRYQTSLLSPSFFGQKKSPPCRSRGNNGALSSETSFSKFKELSGDNMTHEAYKNLML